MYKTTLNSVQICTHKHIHSGYIAERLRMITNGLINSSSFFLEFSRFHAPTALPAACCWALPNTCHSSQSGVKITYSSSFVNSSNEFSQCNFKGDINNLPGRSDLLSHHGCNPSCHPIIAVTKTTLLGVLQALPFLLRRGKRPHGINN